MSGKADSRIHANGAIAVIFAAKHSGRDAEGYGIMADAMDMGSVLDKVSIQDHEVDYEWEDQEPNYYFIEIVHGEKGLFFNGILSLDNQFDPEKLSIECSGFSPDHTNSVVSRLVYDGEEIEGEFDSSREVYTEVRLHDW